MTIYRKLDVYEDNDETPLNNIIQINYLLSRVNIFCIYFMLFVILVLQGLTINYFIMVYNIFEKYNSVNIHEINNYVNKTKIIVDYVCSNLIKC